MSDNNKDILRQPHNQPTAKTKNILISILSLFNKPVEKLLVNLLLLILFAILYFFFVEVKDTDNNRKITFEEAIYFTFTTHFTIGFGNFAPANLHGRIINIIHIVLVWFVNMVPVGILDNFYTSDTNNNSHVQTITPTTSTHDTPRTDKDLLNLALQSNLNLNKHNVN